MHHYRDTNQWDPLWMHELYRETPTGIKQRTESGEPEINQNQMKNLQTAVRAILKNDKDADKLFDKLDPHLFQTNSRHIPTM